MTKELKRVVVTGMGTITLGNSVDESLKNSVAIQNFYQLI
jgi:hypothetical protein